MTFLCVIIHLIARTQTNTNSETYYSKPDTVFSEISLSSTLDTLESGYWKTGDYTVYIKRVLVENYLQENYLALAKAKNTTEIQNDSVSLARLTLYEQRYQKALDMFLNTKSDLDLTKLVVYIGLENDVRNKGKSDEIELIVRNNVAKGNAVVFYKGQRIFKLKSKYTSDYIMSRTLLFFEDENNVVFSYIGHINW